MPESPQETSGRFKRLARKVTNLSASKSIDQGPTPPPKLAGPTTSSPPPARVYRDTIPAPTIHSELYNKNSHSKHQQLNKESFNTNSDHTYPPQHSENTVTLITRDSETSGGQVSPFMNGEHAWSPENARKTQSYELSGTFHSDTAVQRTNGANSLTHNLPVIKHVDRLELPDTTTEGWPSTITSAAGSPPAELPLTLAFRPYRPAENTSDEPETIPGDQMTHIRSSSQAQGFQGARAHAPPPGQEGYAQMAARRAPHQLAGLNGGDDEGGQYSGQFRAQQSNYLASNSDLQMVPSAPRGQPGAELSMDAFYEHRDGADRAHIKGQALSQEDGGQGNAIMSMTPAPAKEKESLKHRAQKMVKLRKSTKETPTKGASCWEDTLREYFCTQHCFKKKEVESVEDLCQAVFVRFQHLDETGRDRELKLNDNMRERMRLQEEGKKLIEVEANLRSSQTRAGSLKTQLESAQALASALDMKRTGLERELGEERNKTKALEAKLAPSEGLERELRATQQELEAFKGECATQKKRIRELESTNRSLEYDTQTAKAQLISAQQAHEAEMEKQEGSVRSRIRTATRELAQNNQALEERIAQFRGSNYIPITDDTLDRRFRELCEEISSLGELGGRDLSSLNVPPSLDPRGYLSRNQNRLPKAWVRFFKSIAWNVAMKGFFRAPLGFGSLGSDGEGHRYLQLWYNLYAERLQGDSKRRLLTNTDTNIARSSLFEHILEQVNEHASGESPREFAQLFAANVDHVAEELASHVETMTGSALPSHEKNMVRGVIYSLGKFSLEMASQRAQIELVFCGFESRISSSLEFRDENGKDPPSWVDIMTRPCLKRVGDGIQDVHHEQEATVITHGQFVARQF